MVTESAGSRSCGYGTSVKLIWFIAYEKDSVGGMILQAFGGVPILALIHFEIAADISFNIWIYSYSWSIDIWNNECC